MAIENIGLKKDLSQNVKRLVSQVHGNELEIYRLLSFKMSEQGIKQVTDLLEPLIENAIRLGITYQKEHDCAILTELQMRLEEYEGDK